MCTRHSHPPVILELRCYETTDNFASQNFYTLLLHNSSPDSLLSASRVDLFSSDRYLKCSVVSENACYRNYWTEFQYKSEFLVMSI